MTMRDSVRQAVVGLVDTQVVASHPLSGGDTAAAFRVELADDRVVFAKTHRNPPVHFFDTEARWLAWLRETMTVPVPAVLATGEDPPLLVLEWIEESHRAAGDDHTFGTRLAAMHLAGADSYGRQDRRTTGSRGLPNDPCPTWAEFYSTQRLLPLARLARDKGVYGNEVRLFEDVADRLDIVGGPTEPPSRLHGDLWAGNRIVDSDGASWLIDPACHGGHREFDLAMMRLFGGFSASVFESYAQAHPLAEGWQERVELHQLAPLLVHAIKFGGHYVPAALEAARRYV